MIPVTSSVMKTGDTYGRYEVLGIFKKDGKYQKYAFVQCNCGSEPRYVQVGVLRNGSSVSCGCFHKEQVTKHGMWKSPIYAVWKNMHKRCYNPKDKRFNRYGGRGISVCDKWHDLKAFVDDMFPTYKHGLTLDRMDNDANYTPDNCRWATRAEQNRNYSRNLVITHDNQTMCLKDWSIHLKINYGTLWDRLYIQNIPFNKAISL